MRTSRRILTVVAAIAFAVACNAVLSFALVPYGSKSEVIWSDYRQQEQMDTVFTGSSLAQRAFDPEAFDAAYGVSSFNMGSPNQSLEESFVAIQTAYRDFGIRRAVIALPHSSMIRFNPPNPGSAFMWERARVVPAGDAVRSAAWMLFHKGAWTETDSLNILVPWTSNHVTATPSRIFENVQLRLTGADVHKAAEAAEKGWHYQGKGYGNYTTVLDYNGEKAKPYFSQNADDAQSEAAEAAAEPNPDRAQTLVEMCRWCAEHNIELVAVGMPIPAFNILDYGPDYFALQESLAQLVQDNGGVYYDFNMARPEVLNLSADMFADSEHLNMNGAAVFGAAFADVLKRHDAGEDVNVLFMGADEWAASINRIETVFADKYTDKQGVHVQARAMCGTNVQVEYRLMKEDADGQWSELQPWSAESSFSWMPDSRGPCTIRVEARQADGGEAERYRDLQFVW